MIYDVRILEIKDRVVKVIEEPPRVHLKTLANHDALAVIDLIRVQKLIRCLRLVDPVNPLMGWLRWLHEPRKVIFKAFRVGRRYEAEMRSAVHYCFSANQFRCDQRFRQRLMLADGQRGDEDAGGALLRQMLFALDGQLVSHHEDVLAAFYNNVGKEKTDVQET